MNFTPDTPAFLQLKDYAVTGEDFSLYFDADLEMLITRPQPNAQQLSRYYESEDYISHTDAKRSAFEFVYQKVKSFALRRKLSLLHKAQKGKGHLLDIGAGTGAFVQAATKAGWDAVGFEPGERAAAHARERDVTLIPSLKNLPDAGFDVITMWHVLEHVPDVSAQIQTLKRLLAPGGLIVVAVPNFKSADAAHYGKHWAAFDVPRHLWHFSKTAIQRLMQRNALEVVETKPMWFDAFYVSLLSEKYKTGSMRPLQAFWQGLKSNFSGRSTGEFSSLIYLVRHRTT